MRGVANLPGLQIPLNRVTRRTFGIGLTGTKKGWFRVAKIVIISLVFSAPFVASCIVLRNSSAANFSFLKVSKIHIKNCERYSASNLGGVYMWIFVCETATMSYYIKLASFFLGVFLFFFKKVKYT